MHARATPPPGAAVRCAAATPSSSSPSASSLHRSATHRLHPPAPLTPRAQATMDFLLSVGTQDIEHSGGSPFSAHLRGVYDVLTAWGAPEPLALAGLAHSVYATDGFQHPSCLPFSRRAEVRAAIGHEAEALVYAFCVTDRATAVGESQDDDALATRPGDPPRTHRWRVRADAGVAEAWVTLDDAQFGAFTALTLADWVEQVAHAARLPNARFGYGPGQAWAYRRRAYAHMADLLGGQAKADYDRVFAAEPAETRGLSFDRPVAVG